MDKAEIGSGAIRAAVLAQGAELCSLRDSAGREMLWQAGPAWPRHAPNLFPIVGRLKDDTLRHGGGTYHLGQHGFARDRRFAWVSRQADACRLVLTDDAATRAMYPFAFRFEVAYSVAGNALRIAYRVANTGDVTLPASVGAHPAFNWPLVPDVAKEAHRIVFEREEESAIFQVKGGLLQQATVPSPVRGRVLALRDELFDADALIFKPVRSRSLRYEAEALTVAIAWDGFDELGIWSRRGGDFVCVEPWHGYASPAEFDGEFADKPGLMHLAPGEARELVITVTLL